MNRLARFPRLPDTLRGQHDIERFAPWCVGIGHNRRQHQPDSPVGATAAGLALETVSAFLETICGYFTTLGT